MRQKNSNYEKNFMIAFPDCLKYSFLFLLQVNISGVAMNHPAWERWRPLGPLQRFSFRSIRFRGPGPDQPAAVVKSCNLVPSQIFGGRGHSTCQKTKSNHVKAVLVYYARPQYTTRKTKKYWRWSKNLCVRALNCVHFLLKFFWGWVGIFWALKGAILLLMFI